MNASLRRTLGALPIVLVTSLFVIGCEEAGTDSSSTAPVASAPSSESVTNSEESTTTSAPAVTTTLPVIEGLTEIWHYASDAIGRELGRGEDFAVAGDLVAALVGNEMRGVAVVDLESGQELWRTDFTDPSGRILEFADGRLTWATYEGVGVHSVDGQPLWEYHFDDARWPTHAVVRGDRTVVALDPTVEGDYGPPLVVQFDQTGNVVWSKELGDSRRDEDLQWVDLLIADDGVIVQTTDALYRLDWTTGVQAWRVPFAEAEVETFGTTGLSYAGGVVYAADPGGEFSGRDGGEILGVDAVSGESRMALQVGPNPRVVGVVDSWLVYTDEFGVNGVNTETDDIWNADMPGAVAVIDNGQVVAVSPNALAVFNPNGEAQSQIPTQAKEPQLQPVIVGEILLVPGWEGTVAIDIATGQTVMTWHGESYSNVVQVDQRRVLLGVAGDGIHLVEVP